MAETILPGTIHRGSEFAKPPDGPGVFGACGPNALDMARAWATQTGLSLTSVYTLMRAHGLCDPSGASTIDELRQAALLLGLSVVDYRGYAEPWAPADFRAWYLKHAGTHYILMETATGQALRDALSGQGENATNLQYHFIGVVGHHDGGMSAHAGTVLPAGWWCVDGDNLVGGNTNANGFHAADVLQFYPEDVMAAAHPCAALAIAGKATPVADNTAGLGQGILDYVRAHNIQGASLIPGGEADLYVGNPTGERIAAFADNDPVYWNGHQVVEGVTGDLVAGLWKANKGNHDQVTALMWQLATANKQLGAAQQTVQQQQLAIQQLTAQLQAAQQQKPAPADPHAAAALAAIQSLKAVLAEV